MNISLSLNIASCYAASTLLKLLQGVSNTITFLKDYRGASSVNSDFSVGSSTGTFVATRSASSPATYVDSSGVIQITTTSNAPRFTYGYHDSTGYTSQKGILIEDSDTNLLTYSNDFTQADWAKSNIQVNTSNDLVEAGGYDAILTSAGNWGGGNTERHFLNANHKSRIRQNGTITQIQFFVKSKSVNLTAFYFEVWRKNGANYDRVSQEDILSLMSNNTTNTITLATPVAVLEGDYVGYGWTCSAPPNNILTANTGFAAGSTYFVTDSAPSSTNYAWESQTASTNLIPLKVFMKAPSLVFVGDSITAGHPAHYSFIETTDTTSIASSTAYNLGTSLGYTYQNMGIGGQTTTNINSRFAADVVALKPRYVVINGGLNDLIAGGTQATFITKYTAMLDSCVSNNIIPIVVAITPWTNGTTAQMQSRDAFNTALQALVATYTNAIYVDASSTIGQFRAGGDANNLWDIKTAYSADGIHMNATGYTALASAIYSALLATSVYATKFPDILNATGANGTVLQAQTIASAVKTFSVYLKRKTGTGNIDLTLDGGSTWTTVTLSSTAWRRLEITQTLANPSAGIRIVTSGDEVYIVGAQMEANAFSSSLIPTTSAALTRSDDETLGYVTSGNRTSDTETLCFKVAPYHATTNLAASTYVTSTDSKSRDIIFSAPGDDQAVLPNATDSATSFARTSTSIAKNVATLVTGVCVSPTGDPNQSIYLDSTNKQDDNTDYTSPVYGTNFWVGSNNLGASQFRGVIQAVAIYSSALSSTQISNVNTILG